MNRILGYNNLACAFSTINNYEPLGAIFIKHHGDTLLDFKVSSGKQNIIFYNRNRAVLMSFIELYQVAFFSFFKYLYITPFFK